MTAEEKKQAMLVLALGALREIAAGNFTELNMPRLVAATALKGMSVVATEDRVPTLKEITEGMLADGRALQQKLMAEQMAKVPIQ